MNLTSKGNYRVWSQNSKNSGVKAPFDKYKLTNWVRQNPSASPTDLRTPRRMDDQSSPAYFHPSIDLAHVNIDGFDIL